MEEEKKKALIIRFNSIGDIVLTTPVIEALNKAGYEVHYLVKEAFKEILEPNPCIDKIWTLKSSLKEVIDPLRREDFEVVIDLHNNIRSWQVKKALKCPSHTLKKDRVNYYLLTKWRVNRVKKRHIVYRFMDVLQPLGIAVDEPKTDFFFPHPRTTSVKNENLPDRYSVIVTGAAWATKCIPSEKIINIIDNLENENIVLIGGPADKDTAKEIMLNTQTRTKGQLINLTGKTSITESAQVIQKSKVVLSGDTGMMHIASSLGKPVVAVFGSTHPILGYTPFYSKSHDSKTNPAFEIIRNEELNCSPCTKQGQDKCPKGHFKCMKDLSSKKMTEKIKSFL